MMAPTALTKAEIIEMEDAGETLGTCDYCGDEGVVFKDNALCQECDSASVHCDICDERQHSDNLCRHVFRTEDCEFNGSGVTSDPGPDVKKSFILLVRLMPGSFPWSLRNAITRGQFYTWLIAPLIGSGGLMELSGCDPMPHGNKYFGYGDRLLEIGSGKHAEDTADGYHWLASLHKDDTAAANLTTVRWLQEYILRSKR